MGSTLSCIKWVMGDKAAGESGYHLTSFSDETKNEWRYTSAPPQLHGVYRKSYIFLSFLFGDAVF